MFHCNVWQQDWDRRDWRLQSIYELLSVNGIWISVCMIGRCSLRMPTFFYCNGKKVVAREQRDELNKARKREDHIKLIPILMCRRI